MEKDAGQKKKESPDAFRLNQQEQWTINGNDNRDKQSTYSTHQPVVNAMNIANREWSAQVAA